MTRILMILALLFTASAAHAGKNDNHRQGPQHQTGDNQN